MPEGARPPAPAPSAGAPAGTGAPRDAKRVEPQRFLRQFELVERVKSYDPEADETLLNRAYVYATVMHGDQKRHSGDPYFAHPVQVAGILTELKLDAETIAAGLLHDTVEDTAATREELVDKFGETVADLVDGVTKLTRLEYVSEQTKQAENLQKFVLAMSKDMRVLLIKLADRLHNMRTIEFVPKETSRKRIARETLEIYAPLARRIGMLRMAEELEDLAFRQIDPGAWATIADRLAALRAEKGDAVSVIRDAIVEALRTAGIAAGIHGREKRPYSIWRKLERKSLTFSDLADIYGFRVIVDTPSQCYAALGVLHRTWRCVPDRFTDYISTPKPNGYRSLHTTVMGPRNLRVEMQIRTAEMDRVAEEGVAAHWRYKNKSYGYDGDAARAASAPDPLEILRPLVQILEHGGDPDEFLEHAKLEMFQDHVFAFTPKGQLIALPSGATPLDFAYALHTLIGDTCVAARINGQDRPLRTELHNGDVVEIIRSQLPGPPPDWESIARTGRARSAIRRLVRTKRREELIRIGRNLADHALHRYGKSLEDTDLAAAAERLGFPEEEDVFEAVARGDLDGRRLAEAAYPGLSVKLKIDTGRSLMQDQSARLYVTGSGLTPGVTLHFSECCSPMPGDRIVGVLAGGARGVDIHTIDCDRLAERDEERWIDLRWTDEAKEHGLAVGRMRVSVENGPGVLAKLCAIVSEHEGNITNVKTLRRSPDFFDLAFDIEVVDVRHLTHIAAAMRACPFVVSVERPRG